MKKIFIGAFLFLVIFGVVIFSVYNYFNGKDIKPDVAITEETEKTESPKIDKETFHEVTKEIGGIEGTTNLNENSSQEEIIDTMHKMTHQKVRARDKWGAIPMTDQTIEEVAEIVEKREDLGLKSDLRKIIKKWKENDFSEIDKNHNSLWNFEGGTVGRAFGIMTYEEELEFVKNNFKMLEE